MPEFHFVKSSHSSTAGECVEVARNVTHTVAVRDSKSPEELIVRFTPDVWREFTMSLS